MTSANTLNDPHVASTLVAMFTRAEHDDEVTQRYRTQRPDDAAPMTAQEHADVAAQAYLPISARGGELLYNLVRAIRPATVVEFGTSFGISTLYLAAAVRDNGTGRVISTELSAA